MCGGAALRKHKAKKPQDVCAHIGVQTAGDKVILSSIFDGCQVDFGDSPQELLAHLLRYAEPALAEFLKGADARFSYTYDWSLNE